MSGFDDWMDDEPGEPLPFRETIDALADRFRNAPDWQPEAASQTKPQAKARKAARADRWRVFNTFADYALRELSPAAALTWIVLFRDTKPDGTARTSESDVAKRIGRSRRTVTIAIAELRQAGLLQIAHQGGLNRGVTVYRVLPTTRARAQ